MLKGTRLLIGKEAYLYRKLIEDFSEILKCNGFQEVILPTIWEAETFKKKIQGDTLEQMWTFRDKGDRECCLIPEATGIIQEMYNTKWKHELPKPICIYYIAKCFRYERPQKGRYREFTQFGCEYLGPVSDQTRNHMKSILRQCLFCHDETSNFTFVDGVTRGLGYYVDYGFEVVDNNLGAQKQVAGGGQYNEGIGWAIGVDRVMLSLLGDK